MGGAHACSRRKRKNTLDLCRLELCFCSESLRFCGCDSETPFVVTAVTASLKQNEQKWGRCAVLDTADRGTALLSRLCRRKGPMRTSRVCTYFLVVFVSGNNAQPCWLLMVSSCAHCFLALAQSERSCRKPSSCTQPGKACSKILGVQQPPSSASPHSAHYPSSPTAAFMNRSSRRAARL